MRNPLRWAASLCALILMTAACGDTAVTTTVGTSTTTTAADTSSTAAETPTTSRGGTTTGAPPPSTTAAGGGEVEIDISGFAFQPGSVTISKGTKVRWRNRDGVTHTTTGGGWNASPAPAARFSFTFDTAGSYPYICTIHPSMTGTITVTD